MSIKNKIVSAANAVALIQDGDTVCTSGFVGTGTPEELIIALEKRFIETGSPRNLTLVFAAAPGDGVDKGANRLAHKGLLKRVIGGHWALVPKIAAMAVANEIEAYNLPMGTITQLFRDTAANRAGLLTKVGIGTFVDPRESGGKLNSVTTEDLVRIMEVDGEEWLFYKAFPIHAAFLRGTTADPAGNITMEREALYLDNLSIAMAAKNSGGFVAAQVERIAARNSLDSRKVHVPRVMVDCIVQSEPENHFQTYATQYNPAYSGEITTELNNITPLRLDDRKIIARRAAFELPMGGIVNLGIGMPEGVSSVAQEENILEYITLTAEPGVIGGMPQAGLNFGAAINTDAIIQQNQQFDFYDGGGLDMATLGMAQVDQCGNVNVSLFGTRIAGAGGFINISQNASKLVFAGTFTAGGLRVVVSEGMLHIKQEGKIRKFISAVQQITFNGKYAVKNSQPVYYVTERCVFRLREKGLELTEIAPGIDIEKDILAHMDFVPIINKPIIMDSRIFIDNPMALDNILLQSELEERISYDPSRNLLFLNLEGHSIQTRKDVETIQYTLEEKIQSYGHKVGLVANYNGCEMHPLIKEIYSAFIDYMDRNYFSSNVQYTTSAFMRLKLGDSLEERKVNPHVFEIITKKQSSENSNEVTSRIKKASNINSSS